MPVEPALLARELLRRQLELDRGAPAACWGPIASLSYDELVELLLDLPRRHAFGERMATWSASGSELLATLRPPAFSDSVVPGARESLRKLLELRLPVTLTAAASLEIAAGAGPLEWFLAFLQRDSNSGR